MLPADCLNEIFEYLEKDMITLYSCLLINRIWCQVSVRILWRNSWNYNACTYNTLIACLPNESKDILNGKGIIIPTPTSGPPMFNYASFCKIISTDMIDNSIEQLLKEQQSITSQNLDDNLYIVAQEIYKLFMIRISSLKKINFYWHIPNIIFTSYPGAKDCLKDLLELHCNSNIYSEILYQLSQICNNIQSIIIEFEEIISNGLKELISVQQNLKYLSISQSYDCEGMKDIIPSLNKLSNTLIKLNLYGGYGIHYIPLSFIANFTNLQEIKLSFNNINTFEGFEKLLFVTFPQLKILKIQFSFPRCEILIRFLEINGKNLKELYLGDMSGESDDSLNLAIAKFCTNLRKLSVGFKNDEIETLKIIFKGCQYLESIKILCGGELLSEKEALETFVKYSSENICELILCNLYEIKSVLLPEELESFFVSWTKRVPQKSLSFIIINDIVNSLFTNYENMKIIENYIKLGVINKFRVSDDDDDDCDDYLIKNY
ncbi:hypothetical protein C1645_837877 [Glomus cerebriforme]|uniref:F-box domain-containing protein n=1 Tax=Glomus cerebriforme TaxID=658196 RepID=A0A397S827_9GLOM|nr:hypothetical protein C1645_837877 [Glomus cerebriforme]